MTQICDKCGNELTFEELRYDKRSSRSFKDMFIQDVLAELTYEVGRSLPTLCSSCSSLLYAKIKCIVDWELIPDRKEADLLVENTLKQDMEEVTRTIREARELLAQCSIRNKKKLLT